MSNLSTTAIGPRAVASPPPGSVGNSSPPADVLTALQPLANSYGMEIVVAGGRSYNVLRRSSRALLYGPESARSCLAWLQGVAYAVRLRSL